MRRILLFVLISCLAIVHVAAARTWVVLPDSTGNAPTIKAAIDSATAGDTIMVACGTYYEYDIHIKSGIYLTSETGSSDCVTIDAQDLGRVFICDYVESTTSIVGFKAIHGRIYEENGGGLYCWYSDPRVTNCSFRYNFAEQNGGGAWLRSSSPVFTNCDFSWNRVNSYSSAGAGVNCTFGSPTFINCTFSHNTWSTCKGGGLSASCDSLTFTGCVFTKNEGGGLSLGGGVYRLTNCTIAANDGSAATSGGIAVEYRNQMYIDNCIIAFDNDGPAIRWTCADPSQPTLTCCDLYGNAGGDWVGLIADHYGVNGNISSDPLFCDLANDDFTLDSASVCLDVPGCGLIGALGAGCRKFAGVEIENVSDLPRNFFLSESVPNPFSSNTVIHFGVPRATEVTLTAHDVSGRQIDLLAQVRAVGEFTVRWDGTDTSGRRVSPGIYFVRMQADGFSAVRKIILLR